MIRNLVSDRRARGLALGLMLVPGIACSSATSRMPRRVAPEIAANAAAQFAQTERTPADLPPGARIRYNTRDSWYRLKASRISRASADTIWLESGDAVPVAGLRRLEVSLTGDTKSGQVLWGGAIGAGIGAVVGASLEPNRCGEGCEGGPGYPASRGTAAAIFGLYGAMIGLLGTSIIAPPEKWERVALPSDER